MPCPGKAKNLIGVGFFINVNVEEACLMTQANVVGDFVWTVTLYPWGWYGTNSRRVLLAPLQQPSYEVHV